MHINIQTPGIDRSPIIEARIRDQISRALAHCKPMVTRADAFLKDVNGPRGGRDKLAMIRVCLQDHNPVVVESVHEDFYAAIDVSARRLRRAVKRKLGRQRRLSRSAGRLQQGLRASLA